MILTWPESSSVGAFKLKQGLEFKNKIKTEYGKHETQLTL